MKKLSYIIRDLLKFRGATYTKIISLTIGLSVGILAFSYCAFEMNYDNFHPDVERIYRIGSLNNNNYIQATLLSEIVQNIPEIEEATCLSRYESSFESGKYIYSRNSLYADTSFLNVFSFQILSGDPAHDLNYADRIFISQRFARTLFGDGDPLGQQVKSGTKLWTIAGVFQDIPRNCHLGFEVLLPLKAQEEKTNKELSGEKEFSGYIKLNAQANPDTVCKKIQAIADSHTPQEQQTKYQLQALPDIHLKYEMGYSYVILIGVIGGVIVIVSALNYILIAISSLVRKTKEIGIHKVNGASTANIFNMFLTETIVLVIITGLLAIGVLFSFQQFFEYLMYINYTDLFTTEVFLVIFCFVVLMILLTGVIPAHVFATVPVLHIFRKVIGERHSWKHILLWAQFVSACLLITLLIIFTEQYNMMMNKNLGYNTRNLYYIQMTCGGQYPSLVSVKSEIEQLPYISGTSFVNTLPLWAGGTTLYDTDGEGILESRILETDENFFSLMDIPLLEGSTAHEIFQDKNNIIINKKFQSKLDAQKKTAKELVENDRPAIISGICRDFQVISLYALQQPLLIRSLQEPDSNRRLKLLMKISPATPDNINTITLKLRQMSGQSNLYIQHYQSVFQGGYEGEKDMCTSMKLFSILAIVIAILGLFGFTGDEVTRRTKEIAIRKINGASTASVTFLLLRNICILAILSMPFALAGAYVISQIWLEDFAYRIPLSAWIFISGAVSTFSIILITVLLKSQRGIRTRPADALKSE